MGSLKHLQWFFGEGRCSCTSLRLNGSASDCGWSSERCFLPSCAYVVGRGVEMRYMQFGAVRQVENFGVLLVEAISYLNDIEVLWTNIGNFVQNVRLLMERLSVVEVHYQPRQANRVAHSLAQFGLKEHT
ncbi:PREDICTED: uncharacterized protein [Prunus dulcis]|uniref:PREDICTED: uncharacterized protein n=1 Tax=Prunus dulcis TaxID=3755 RepID=A0A5E4G2C3_PRUDU|nr:PREDICTED: uncharacterized protein [Prunus dulcis]